MDPGKHARTAEGEGRTAPYHDPAGEPGDIALEISLDVACATLVVSILYNANVLADVLPGLREIAMMPLSAYRFAVSCATTALPYNVAS